MVLHYAEGGNFNDWVYKNYKVFDWSNKLYVLFSIIGGLKRIHEKYMVHRDFHSGNILIDNSFNAYISDMGLCSEIGNIDESKIYGVMSYVAPEVLRGKTYSQAADIYSFGMIMYFTATGRQPFANLAHDHSMALKICNGMRPEINEAEAPKCYIDLMKRCWDSNPDNRPKAIEIKDLIELFHTSYTTDASIFKYYMKIEKEQQHYEIEKQFKEAEEYRKSHLSSFEENKSITHTQAIYTPRLLNPYTSELLVCNSTVDITDFTM
jgi:serine/threonine protein kinase